MKDTKDIINSTAKFFINVFSDTYDEAFEELLKKGGGGNSMFVNAWVMPSSRFIKHRISGEAKKRLEAHGYTIDGYILPSFYSNNEKKVDGRRLTGKELHKDHNPGNVKVLQLIRDKVRSYPDVMPREEKIAKLARYIQNIQTVDWITIEQDDVRTFKDEVMSKAEKNMLTAKERDALLNDTWEWFVPANKRPY